MEASPTAHASTSLKQGRPRQRSTLSEGRTAKPKRAPRNTGVRCQRREPKGRGGGEGRGETSTQRGKPRARDNTRAQRNTRASSQSRRRTKGKSRWAPRAPNARCIKVFFFSLKPQTEHSTLKYPGDPWIDNCKRCAESLTLLLPLRVLHSVRRAPRAKGRALKIQRNYFPVCSYFRLSLLLKSRKIKFPD